MQAEELQRIQHDLAVDLSVTSDLSEAMDRLLETISRIESIDCGGVYLMNDRTGNLELVSYKGLSQLFVENVSHYSADSPRVRLVMKGEPLYGFYPDIFPDMSDIHKQESLRAFATIPVQYEGKVIAVLNLASHTHDEISDDARNLIEGIAAQIGGAVTRVRTEEALRESRQKFDTMAENIPGILFQAIVHKDGSITLPYVSPSARKFGLYSAKEMSVQPELLQVVIHPDYHEQFKKMAAAASGKLEPVDWEIRLNTQFTSIEFIRVIARPQATADGDVAWDGLALDITTRKQAEESLRESERRLRNLIESSHEVVFSKDLDGRYHTLNLKAATGLGCTCVEDAEGKTDYDLLPKEQADALRKIDKQVIESGTLTEVEEIVRNAQGEDRTYLSKKWPSYDKEGRKIGLNCFAMDITEHKRAEQERQSLEEQLSQAVKMEAIGRLAGGIAHDFNNMLAIIQGYADLLLKSMDQDNQYRDDVESIRTASKRASALTGQLLAFGRKQAVQPKVLNLNEIIADADSMLQRIIGEDIELVMKPGKDPWYVSVDPRQIEEQVIINLAVNAREAMPDGGKLTVETANVVLDEEYTARHAEVEPGEYVMLTVSDTGVGMSEEIISHVFEPFFTTKAGGESSGLGLSIIYGIVKQSGGHIDIDSTPGRGTTFRIYLPRVKGAAEKTDEDADKTAGRQTRGGKTILVAEDEQLVRQFLVRVLREAGYTVLETGNAQEAIPLGEHYDRPIHLLVTDVIMPGTSGDELAKQLTEKRPETKVLYISGHAGGTAFGRNSDMKGINFLAKPFSSNKLIKTVRSILDADNS